MADGKKVQMDSLMAAKGMMLWTKQQHGRNTSMSGEWTAIGLQSHYLKLWLTLYEGIHGVVGGGSMSQIRGFLEQFRAL